jgi:hypothetical protein
MALVPQVYAERLELTVRTDGATNHNWAQTAFSACLSSPDSVKAHKTGLDCKKSKLERACISLFFF